MVKRLKPFIEKYKSLAWAFSFGLLFQAWWMRDFSASYYVGLPLFYKSGMVLGTEWFFMSMCVEIIALIMMFASQYDKLHLNLLYPMLFYVAGDIIAIVSFFQYKAFHMALATYGIIWNDALYFIMIPAIIITNALLLKNS